MGRLGASLDGAKLGSPSAGLPSPRGYSYGMQYRTFISQPARYLAYERGKDLSTSLPLTIRSSALHSWHTGRYVEGVPLRGTSILRLRRAPFGFIGRRPSGQARHLFGWSQTRASLCRTPVSKWLLIWHAIPRSPLISKLATPLFYDAPHQSLEPINLKPYAFTTNHAMSER